MSLPYKIDVVGRAMLQQEVKHYNRLNIGMFCMISTVVKSNVEIFFKKKVINAPGEWLKHIPKNCSYKLN